MLGAADILLDGAQVNAFCVGLDDGDEFTVCFSVPAAVPPILRRLWNGRVLRKPEPNQADVTYDEAVGQQFRLPPVAGVTIHALTKKMAMDPGSVAARAVAEVAKDKKKAPDHFDWRFPSTWGPFLVGEHTRIMLRSFIVQGLIEEGGRQLTSQRITTVDAFMAAVWAAPLMTNPAHLHAAEVGLSALRIAYAADRGIASTSLNRAAFDDKFHDPLGKLIASAQKDTEGSSKKKKGKSTYESRFCDFCKKNGHTEAFCRKKSADPKNAQAPAKSK